MDNQRGTNQEPEKNKTPEENQHPSYEEGSKSDPQMTELEGLKKGGKEPHVHETDKPRDEGGEKDA